MSEHLTNDGRAQDTEAALEEDATQIGRAVTRTDAAEKVTGETVYTMDMYPDEILHAKLVTSEKAHAEIEAVDTTDARQLDGVVAVATASDVPETRIGRYIRDEPIFAREKVRYVGEPIAVVAAESEAIAEKAVDRVEVTYDPLPSVTDLTAASKQDPPATVHEDLREYGTGEEGFHIEGQEADRPNLLTTATEASGDLESAFERADLVFEDEYKINPLQHSAMEHHVAVAEVDADGVNIWTSHQIPHAIRRELPRLFPEMDHESVVINTPFAGGAFGGKENPIVEPRLLAVARQTDRPVRLALTREQQYTTSPSRPEFHIRLKDGVMSDGTIVARDMTMDINAGGYDEEVFNIANSVPSSILGSYRIPAVRRRCNAIYTNRPPYGAFRGFGLPEANFAVERHMDRVADKLGMDPLEYRAQNLLEAGDQNAIGETLRPCQNSAVLESPVERIRDTDIEAEFPDYSGDEWELGVGFAYGNKAVPQGVTAVKIDLEPTGELTARVGAPDVGQGSNTVVSQMVAEEFGTSLDQVEIIAGDTDETERDLQGPSGSRFTPYTGNAIRIASDRLQQELTSLASSICDIDDSDTLRVVADQVVSPEEGPLVSVAEIAASPEASESDYFEAGVFSARGEYEFTEQDHIYWVPVAQGVVVACNTLTGKVDVLRVITAADVGQAINPKAIEQQLEGGTGQGIGSALFEEIIYDDGHVVNGNFKAYNVPKATELPYESETIVFESVDTEGPFGAKSVGEIGLFPTPPAIAGAIDDALGVDLTVLPMTPQRILARLKETGNTGWNSDV